MISKDFPDALSKTVPIWCAVLNRLLFPDLSSTHGLERLSPLISPSEHSQIESKIDGFVQAFKVCQRLISSISSGLICSFQTLDLNIADLRGRVGKPLRPIWISRSLDLPTTKTLDDLSTSTISHPVFLCMSSLYQESSITESYSGYVQGAGDDAESWAFGLTPQLFWSNHSKLLDASEDELPDLIKALLQAAENVAVDPNFVQILPVSQVLLGPLPQGGFDVDPTASVIICAPSVNEDLRETLGTRLLHLKTAAGKLGSRDLRTELPKLTEFMRARSPRSSIFVACATGKDISAGVALALLCLYVDEKGIYMRTTHVSATSSRKWLTFFPSPRKKARGHQGKPTTIQPSSTKLSSARD